jgi:MYXO-CTERM domain-containing protein
MRTRTIASALVLAGVLAQPALVYSQSDPTVSQTDTMAQDRDDHGEWGWVGLLGLAGLLGLRRRDRVDLADKRRDNMSAQRPV